MDKKNVHDRRTIKLEDILKEDYIPYLGGRPVRDTVIGSDDLINLKIILETNKCVESLIKAI